MTSHSYTLRSSTGRNYCKLANIKLPRERIFTGTQSRYVVERDGSQARIHYVGYGSNDDEWRDISELVELPSALRKSLSSNGESSNTPIQPYSLYNELKMKIKQSLVCGRKQSPLVVIDMGFDYLLFKGGLEAVGTPKQKCGNQRYLLKSYRDLDPLLGKN